MKKIRLQVMAPAIVVILLILTTAFFTLEKLLYEHISARNTFVSEHLNEFIDADIHKETTRFIGLFDRIKNDIQVQQAWKMKQRDELYAASRIYYQSMNQSHQVTHLSFHDLNKVDFLRVHNPNRFGEIVNRYTLAKAVKTQQTISGIEIDSFGQIVLRVVSPWVIDNQLVGYIEIGKEVENILKDITEFLNIDIVTLINKNKLAKNKWEMKSQQLGRHTAWDKFTDYVVVESFNLKQLPNSETLIDHALTHQQNTRDIIETGGRYYFTGNFPLLDFTQHRVGFLVFFHDITDDVAQEKQLAALLIDAGLALAIILMLSYYFYLGHLQESQAKLYQQLTIEVKRLTASELKLRQIYENIEKTNDDLISNEKMLHLVINALPLGIFWKDKNGYYLGCNKRFAMDAGLKNADEIVGKTDFRLAWKEKAAYYRKDDDAIIQNKTKRLQIEEKITIANQQRWLEMNKIPLWNEQKEVLGVLGWYQDITAKKLVKAELKQ